MKQLSVLILLFYTALPAHADTTLTFSTHKGENTHSLTYYIKNQMLRFNEQGSDRVNIFDASKQAFVTVDQSRGTIARIDQGVVAQRVDQLNKLRLQKLAAAQADIDRKIQGMSEKEQEVAVSVLNQLKYPEFYGAHTLLQVKPTAIHRQVTGVDCRLYQIRRQNKLLKTICMAQPQALDMNQEDYHTLRQFYHFNYSTQTSLLIASGKTSFSYVDYDQQNMPGIAVEITEYTDNPDHHPSLQIQQVSTKMLEPSLFEIQMPKK